MTKKPIYHKKNQIPFAPTITTIAFPMLLWRKKKKTESVEQPEQEKPRTSQKPKIKVEKCEIKDDIVKLFAVKGLFKKNWAIVEEIPILEIQNVEINGNVLSITRNGIAVDYSVVKESETFAAFRDQVLELIEKEKNSVNSTQKISQQKANLSGALNVSLGLVDSAFNILINLEEKRTNWSILENDSANMGKGFSDKTFLPLQLDFSEILVAINKQDPRKVTQGTFEVLKKIYDYFYLLKPNEDLKESGENIDNTKSAIMVYYILNDLILAKIVGEKDSGIETLALESMLQKLADSTNVKMNWDVLRLLLANLAIDASKSDIEQARSLVKDQLRLL